jgi:CRISPR system Cascade subunit CasA
MWIEEAKTMTATEHDLLTQPLIRMTPGGASSLPGVLAALARDDIDGFPALRPHQSPAWHMFLVQLAALALHGAGESTIPTEEEAWERLLRGLTPSFPADEPWCLVVEDVGKPAFLQPPVPAGVSLPNSVPTPDALDLLITSRNHDLKQTVARRAAPDDWVFALVSLQTGEGYGGAGNQGIARMNGGSSSRAMLTLAPRPKGSIKATSPRLGAWFARDVRVLLATRESEVRRLDHLGYPESGGLGLVWLAPWPEGEQVQLDQLDPWFIEVCRRVRLFGTGDGMTGKKGTSKATRINAKHLNGAVGDPFAPIDKTENKSFTLAGRDFDYRTLSDLLFSGTWDLPLLARPAAFEPEVETFILVAEALARGNSKTEGFKSRTLPVSGTISYALSLGPRRQTLHALAKAQIETIVLFRKALAYALALAATGGDHDKIKKEHYAHARTAETGLDRGADAIFFPYLWERFEVQDQGPEADRLEAERFARALFVIATEAFRAALPAIPCAGLFRPRAQARAEAAFSGRLWASFPELFQRQQRTETDDAA